VALIDDTVDWLQTTALYSTPDETIGPNEKEEARKNKNKFFKCPCQLLLITT